MKLKKGKSCDKSKDIQITVSQKKNRKGRFKEPRRKRRKNLKLRASDSAIQWRNSNQEQCSTCRH